MEGPGETPVRITPDMVLRRRIDFERRLRRAPLVTLGLLAAMALVPLLTVIGRDEDGVGAAYLAGAIVREPIAAGEWWRLVTATFLHAGFDHLLGNALGLYILGLVCEHAWGGAQLLVIWAAGALAGWAMTLAPLAEWLAALAARAGAPGLAEWLAALAGDPDATTLGASGAIFGLLGAALVFFVRYRRELLVRHTRMSVVLGAWMVYAVATGLVTPAVANAAHVGGALGGALIALGLAPAVLRPVTPARRWVVRVLACGLGAVAVWACVEWLRTG